MRPFRELMRHRKAMPATDGSADRAGTDPQPAWRGHAHSIGHDIEFPQETNHEPSV